MAIERKTQHAIREGMMQTGIEATKHAVTERSMIHIVIGREVQCSAAQCSAAQCISIVGSKQFCHLTRAIAPTSASFGTVSHPLYTNFHSFSDLRSRIEMQFKNLSTDILRYIRGSSKICLPWLTLTILGNDNSPNTQLLFCRHSFRCCWRNWRTHLWFKIHYIVFQHDHLVSLGVHQTKFQLDLIIRKVIAK